jgi:NTE family protein
MGALVGGIYATGKLDTYTRWVSALEKIDVIRLLDFSFSRSGLFKGERIITVLRDLIGDKNIEDLPISYTAVATDIDAEKEVWLNEGPLFDAIRASIAIPSIFTPHRHQGRTLVDGGIINPIPIAPTLQDITDITIAVNLSGKTKPTAKKQDKKTPLPASSQIRQAINKFTDDLYERFGGKGIEEMDVFDLLSRSMETMENSIARLKLAAYSPDYTIDIPANACSFYEFYRAEELIELGYLAAIDTLKNLE